jgi:hypothetical protein
VLVINKANAIISVTPYSVTYDGNPHTATGTATGVGGVDLSSELDLSYTTHTSAGTYSSDYWTFTDAAGNYNNVPATTITDQINARPATWTTNANSKTYGSADPIPLTTGSGTNFVAADNVTATYSRAPGETVKGGPYQITATLSPAAVLSNYNITNAGASFTVNPANTTTKAAMAAATYGQPSTITLSATVTVNSPSQATVNEGTVTFTVTGFGSVTSSTISGGSASASFSVSGIPAGIYAITATYNPGNDFNTSYGANTLTVMQATTTTTVVSSVNPSTFMQLVTFTATVTPQYSGTMPTGIVTFQDTFNGSTITLGIFTLTALNGGVATLSTSSLQDNFPNIITAVYSGDNNFIASNNNSSPVLQTVEPAPNVSLSPQSVSFGNQNVNTTSKPAIVTLTNIGDAALTISANGISITPNTDFALTNNCGSSVPAGKSCTISVTFTPVDTGIRTASLQITDNDDDATNAQQIVSLTGAGLSTIPGSSLYTDAIFATANGCGSIVMSGGSTVDSFNSTQGYSSSHQLSGGNVGTNGNVTLNGSKSAIYGLAAVDSMTTGNCTKTSVTGVTTSGGAQVTGGMVPLNDAITYPVPPAPTPAPPTTTQNISGSCGTISGCTNIGTKMVSLAPGPYGNLSISGGTTAHFSKGTYNINSLTLSGQSILYVDSGPVIVNLAGASLSGGNAAMDATGGSIQNPSGVPSNLQFTYAGSRGLNLSGGAGSYATVDAPNALVNMSGGSDFFGSIIASTVTNSGGTAIHYDSSLPDISGGNYIWFNAVVNNVNGLPSGPNAAQVKLYLTNSTISFTANGTPYNVPVSNSVVTFNSASQTYGAKTTYDLANSRWSTAVAKSGLTGNTFVTGVAFPVPSDFPTGIQNVAWSASFSTDTPGITLQWQWGAAVYKSFSTTYATTTPVNSNVLGVNAEDGSADMNGTDPAGTPESYKASLTFGATGGGGTNYTGYFSPGAGVVPTVAPMSVSPSSLDFGSQSQGTTTAVPLTAVLTNNDSNSHNFPVMGTKIMGTNASDFTLVTTGANNCVGMTSLAAGANCTLYVTFTPSDVGTRTAKIVINDDANNSPQTVYLTGSGQ